MAIFFFVITSIFTYILTIYIKKLLYMENIEKIIRQQLTEAVYSSVSGQKLPLSYSIGFQPKKNLKTGTIQNFAYLNLKLQDPTDALTLKNKFHAELKKGSNTI